MAQTTRKKLEGLAENTSESRAIFGFRKGGEIAIDLIPFNWVARRGDTVVPLVQLDDGTTGPADVVDGYLGIELGPIEDEDKVAEFWVDKVEAANIRLPIEDDDTDDDTDDEDDDEDDEDDDEPVRVRPRRR